MFNRPISIAPCVGWPSLLLLCAAVAARAWADEGQWLLTRPPLEALKARYGFEPTAEWLEHQQKSAAIVGASGSFVSADGLILTNHHVAFGALERLSSAERNLVRDGFLAARREDELRCPGEDVLVLWSIEDVTARVSAALPENPAPTRLAEARKAILAQLESESERQTGLHSEVITLYRGARYHLYRYRRCDDVRLVWAPESAVAAFGGDVDNFEYPRFALDAALLRAYENGQPMRPERFLTWSQEGVRAGDLVLAFGHPGRTERQLTAEDLLLVRDVQVPAQLNWALRREAQLAVFRSREAEQRRVAAGSFLGVQNWRKALVGAQEALLDPGTLAAKRERDRQLREWIEAEPQRRAEWGGAFERIAAAGEARRELFLRERLLEAWGLYDARLLDIALALVRLADELPKPSGERLREYRESDLESAYLRLYRDEPIHDAQEVEGLAAWLGYLCEQFGGDDPLVVALLAGQSPRTRAAALVRGTRLRDVTLRRRLAAGGRTAIDASDDAMIRFARLLDPAARAVRLRVERELEGVHALEYGRLAAARFARDGEEVYPDATGTLRLSFGAVRGYREAERDMPAMTTLAGLFERAEQRGPAEPFALPARWQAARARLALDTPLNFVATTDIVGGNSGSPVVNRDGELVGLIFDGNLPSLSWQYAYSEEQARAIAVDARAIIEALRKVYGADRLVEELLMPR
jgi:hypothetical protein